MRINWSNPINWDHSLNRDLGSWWMVTPHARGGLIFRDLVGRHYGDLTNMDQSVDWLTDGRPGGWGALDFDSVGPTKVRVLDPNGVLNMPIPMSFMFWYSKNGWVDNDGFAGKFDSTGSNRVYGIWTSGGTDELSAFRYDGGNFRELIVTSSTLYDGRWCAVIMTFRATNDWSIYAVDADGTFFSNDTTTTVGNNTTVNPLVFGSSNDADANHITASMDCFRLWNRAVSLDEFKDLVARDVLGSVGLLRRLRRRGVIAPAAVDISHVAALADSFDNVVQRRPIKVTSY